MQLEISVLSKPGGRSANEDACGFWSSPTTCFCVVSDGAGGHRGGDVASKLVVQHVLAMFKQIGDSSEAAIKMALKSANSAIIAEQQRSSELSDMRATVVVLAVDTARRVAAWGHLGDSRLYCFRQRRVIVQTRDHSVAQNMVDAGYLQQAEIRALPKRNALMGALGEEDGVEPLIETGFAVNAGDTFLLCTDGLWEYIEEAMMERLLKASNTMEEWLKVLESEVLAQGRAAQDNYSALVISCSDADEVTLMRPSEVAREEY